ncbi:MoaD/ThiS family protein [Spirosoma endophyticum]|uniref:Molybdopterin synthase sulfur carrier subunit n=1 Tax=Spirosoma endophyticum TaxID=662367 RepID=A0A1I1VM38_9BACT|nr:MoaD/ThiS family protein [Spirosoma endophyticum]SFD84132.1 molybdopterin synthase sulfur carrier subunit [Spirosoma endophyticum]
MSAFISVLLFGMTRDLTGHSSVLVPIHEPTRVGDLLSQLHQDYPALAGLRTLLVAVNGEYAEVDQEIGPTDEIALIPPVSGG